MFDLFPLAQVSSWPVYVTVAEARAYASWRGKRLPTEAEFQRACYGGPDEISDSLSMGRISSGASSWQFRFYLMVAESRRLPSSRGESMGYRGIGR